MVTVTETQVETETESPLERERWWRRWTVPAIPVMIGMLLLTVGVCLALLLQRQDREATALAISTASCHQQAEFRSFFAEYLESQIGTPVEDIPGFDQLSPEARAFAVQLAPVIEANRERDEAAYAEYVMNFPIPNCDN